MTDVGRGLASALPFLVDYPNEPVGRGVIDAVAALNKWHKDYQAKDVAASRQSPEERRMSRGEGEKGLSPNAPPLSQPPGSVSWHPIERAAAMVNEFGSPWEDIQRASAKLTGLPGPPQKYPEQPWSQSLLRGEAAQAQNREEKMADMPSLPSMPKSPREAALRTTEWLGGIGHSRPQPPLAKSLAAGAYNAAADLGNVVSAVPGVIAQTVLPRVRQYGETDEQAAQRAVDEGRELGRGVKQGLLGGTVDMLKHPLESALTQPFTTAATLGGPLRAGVNLGKAGLMKAGVPAEMFKTPIDVRGSIIDRAAYNLRDGLMKHSGPLADLVTEDIGPAAGWTVAKAGKSAADLIDQYIAKFVDGFHSGDPRVTVMAEEFARDKEKAHAAGKAAIGKLAGGMAREMERTPTGEQPLPGLPGQAPAPVAPGAPPAPTMTMPPREPITATGTPVADIGAAPVPEPTDTNALGPQAPLFDRAQHILQDALKDHPKAKEYLDGFAQKFAAGDPTMLHMADGLVNHPEFLEQFKRKIADELAGPPQEAAPGVPVREQTQKQPLYGAQARSEDMPVEAPRDAKRAERAAKFGPGVQQHVQGVVDEFMRHSTLPEDARPALRQEVMLALEDAMGGEGNTANWRGQMRGNPEQFAKDLIAAAEKKLGSRLTDKAKAMILDTLDKRDKQGLQLLSIQKTPEGTYEVVRTTRIPIQKNRAGVPEQLHPEDLVAPRKMTPTEVHNAVQAQLEESMKDRMDAAEVSHHAKTEAARAVSDKAHGPVGADMLEVARDLYKNAVVDSLLNGVTDRESAIHQLAQAAHNVVEGRRTGGVIPQIFPVGMKPADVGAVIREYSQKFGEKVDKATTNWTMKNLVDKNPQVPQGKAAAPKTKLFGKAVPNKLHAQRLGEYADHLESTYGDEYTKHAAALRDIAKGKSVDQALADHWPIADQFERGQERDLLNEMVDIADPAKAPLKGEPVAPGEVPASPTSPTAPDPGVVDTTANREPPRKLSAQEAKHLHDLAWEVQGYKALDPEIGFGTKADPAFGNALLGDALKWHVLSEKALQETGALGMLDKWFKSNMTNKSIAAGVNNFVPNISQMSIRHGVDPITMLARGSEVLKALADWHGEDTTHISPDMALAFDNLDKAGVGMDFVQHQLGDKALSPSEVLRGDKFTTWLRNPATDMPHTRVAKWFYRYGDQVLRIQEGVAQFERALDGIKGLGDGEYYDLSPTKREQVRITKQGDQYFAENPYALEAKDRAPTEISEDQLNRMIGKDAAHKSTMIVQDYPDMPQLPKMLTANPWWRVLSSPFKSWAAGTIDLPGKAGLVTNTLFRSPFSVSSNSPRVLAQAGARELRASLGRSMGVNGVNSALVKQGSNGVLANQFRNRPDDDQRIIMGNLTDPHTIEAIKLGQWANIGPTLDVIGALVSLATKPEQAREHGMAEAGTLTEFGKEVVAADTGKNFNTARAMRLAFLSGGTIANIWDAIESDAKAGHSLNIEKLTTTLANSLVGGTTAAGARALAGYLADTGPEEHLRVPVSSARNAMAEMSGRARTTENPLGKSGNAPSSMPFMSYLVSQIIGKAWQASDFNAMNQDEVHSILHKMGLSMKEGLDVKSKEAAKAAAKSAIAHASPEEREAQTALEREELDKMTRLRKVIDNTVKRLWLQYKQTYNVLKGQQPKTGSK